MSTLPPGIRHIVVLMLENRSFDHLLGNLPGVDGPTSRSNIDPKDGSVVPVTFDADYFSPALPDPKGTGEMLGDPHHDVIAVNRQLFETDAPSPGATPTCGGFILAGRESGDADAELIAREVMRSFDAPAKLETLTSLANAFVVCDRWFASVPGPTWPNRLFAHAATSSGHVDNNFRPYDMPTIYDTLDEVKVDWAIYYHDVPQSLCIHELLDRTDSSGRQCMRSIDDFYRDAKKHTAQVPTLAPYTFIEPGYFEPPQTWYGRLLDFLKWVAHSCGAPVKPSKGHPNDMHAPHDVRLGEHLVADVYEALRSNDEVWNHSLLIVLTDEHGGLYDHVAPGAAANPDGKVSTSPPFGFDRLGLRVPAILVSPFLKPDVHVDSTPYEHASIIATVQQTFAPAAKPLNARAAAAAPLRADLFAPSPRAGDDKRLPRPAPVFWIPRHGDPESRPLNDLHESLVDLAASAGAMPPGAPASAAPADEQTRPRSEGAAHSWVRARVRARLGGKRAG
ncbi:MAG: alkaline phosphatase family protein [Gemmatimonadales bacterium]